MKSIDFSKPGGFPLTQDQLDYLQTGYTEAIGAMNGIVGDGSVPVTVAGMARSTSFSGIRIIADGWLFFTGQLIRFVSGSYNPVILGFSPYIVISDTSAPLTYNDTVTRNVVNERTATVVNLASSTPEDATHIALYRLLDYGTAFGQNGRESIWQHITVITAPGSGSIAGDIYYKKDRVANTLQVRGEILCGTGNDFAAWPNVSSVVIGTLISGYRPANRVFFTVQTVLGGGNIVDINGTYFTRLNAALDTDGKFYVDWIKPDAGSPIYGMNFNLVLPLD